jgi:uncharacterized membrane protein
MWTREELKTRAKDVLRKNYWMALLVCFIAGILGGGGGGSFPGFNFNLGDKDFSKSFNGNFDSSFNEAMLILIPFIIGVFIFVMIIAIAWQIFLGNAILAGKSKYFLEARKDSSEIKNLFYAFNAKKYLNIIKAMVWRDLFIFLWSLLLIIPGIVKSYSYRMVPYLMAENQQLRYDEALKLSMKITDGEKGEIFVLDLSFIGWYLLGLLACCIGVLFVTPYYEATMAELYITLRDKAITSGKISYSDINPIVETTENPVI